jgi:hypothetical protein
MRVGITGGTGYLGQSLAQALLERGDPVRVFGRDAGRVNRTFGGRAEAVAWDPAQEIIPSASLEDLDAVVHLAGEPVVGGRWSLERKQRIRDSRVLGTRHLAEGWEAAARRPARLLSSSAVGYYGDTGDRVVEESSPPGRDFLAEVAADWEDEAGAVARMGASLVLLRTGLVLGRKGGMLPRVIPPFRLGVGGRLGSGRQWMPWIHIRDWTDLVLFALDRPEVKGPLNLVAPHPVRNAEFSRSLARALGRPALFPVPVLALRLLLAEGATAVLSGQRIRPAAAEAHGFKFSFPDLESALRDLID